MAIHFARGIINREHLTSTRLSASALAQAQHLPTHRRIRFLASRSLLAELMFMLYDIDELPDIEISEQGRPAFHHSTPVDFSIAYTGNMVGIALNTEGRCGLAMELQHTVHHFHCAPQNARKYQFQGHESIWISNQNDPCEARAQLMTLRQSILKLCGNRQESVHHLQLLPGSGRLRLPCTKNIEALSDAEDVLVWSMAATPGIKNVTLWEFDIQQGWSTLPDIASRHKLTDTRLIRFTNLSMDKTLTMG